MAGMQWARPGLGGPAGSTRPGRSHAVGEPGAAVGLHAAIVRPTSGVSV